MPPICGTDLLGNAVTYTDECNIAFITWQNSCEEDSEILLRFIHDGPCDGNQLTEGKQNQHTLPIAKILSAKNARAWVSMDFT